MCLLSPTVSQVKRAYLRRTTPKASSVLLLAWRIFRPDFPLLLVGYISLVIAAAGEALVPLLYGLLVDTAAIQKDAEAFQMYVLALVGVAAVTGFFTGCRGSVMWWVGGSFSARLRQRLYDSLLRQESNFFNAVKTGDITSRLSADCERIEGQVTYNLNIFLRSTITIGFTLAFMATISPRLMALCFIAVPLIVVLSQAFGEMFGDVAEQTQNAMAKANADASEVVSAIATTRVHFGEPGESKRYADGQKAYMKTVYRAAKIYFFFSASTYTFAPYLARVLVLCYVGQLVSTPQLWVIAHLASPCSLRSDASC